MSGAVIFWICILILLPLAGSIALPVRCRIRLSADVRGGGLEIFLSQPLWRVRFFYRISLCEPPYFTIRRIRNDGRAERAVFLLKREERNKSLPSLLLSALHVEKIDLDFRVGILGEPHITAILCAFLSEAAEQAAKALLPEAVWSISAAPVFSAMRFRVNLACMIKAYPVKIIGVIARNWRNLRAAPH